MQVQTDESTGNILNLVMVEADEGTMLKVNLPVVFKGEDVCPGLKKGISLPISIF
jgi:large subunit ribosomal protein L25